MTDRAPSPADGEAIRPSDLRKVITEALDEAERVGMTRPVTDEWVSIKLLASPALATLRAHERANALHDAADVAQLCPHKVPAVNCLEHRPTTTEETP